MENEKEEEEEEEEEVFLIRSSPLSSPFEDHRPFVVSGRDGRPLLHDAAFFFTTSTDHKEKKGGESPPLVPQSRGILSPTRSPVTKIGRSTSSDNPFAIDGELSRTADYIVANSTFSRNSISIVDPDLQSPSSAAVAASAAAPCLSSPKRVSFEDASRSSSIPTAAEDSKGNHHLEGKKAVNGKQQEAKEEEEENEEEDKEEDKEEVSQSFAYERRVSVEVGKMVLDRRESITATYIPVRALQCHVDSGSESDSTYDASPEYGCRRETKGANGAGEIVGNDTEFKLRDDRSMENIGEKEIGEYPSKESGRNCREINRKETETCGIGEFKVKFNDAEVDSTSSKTFQSPKKEVNDGDDDQPHISSSSSGERQLKDIDDLEWADAAISAHDVKPAKSSTFKNDLNQEDDTEICEESARRFCRISTAIDQGTKEPTDFGDRSDAKLQETPLLNVILDEESTSVLQRGEDDMPNKNGIRETRIIRQVVDVKLVIERERDSTGSRDGIPMGRYSLPLAASDDHPSPIVSRKSKSSGVPRGNSSEDKMGDARVTVNPGESFRQQSPEARLQQGRSPEAPAVENRPVPKSDDRKRDGTPNKRKKPCCSVH